VVVQSNLTIALEIAQRDDVAYLEPNTEFRVNLETPEVGTNVSAPQAIEWNVQWVKADQVWNDYEGDGHVVANADTGVAWKHPALINRYRGSTGGNVNHNYNWWDAIHGGSSNRCGFNTQEPCDDNGHGTHTTGTAVGYDPNTDNHIGVAPGATWIGCRNMNAGVGTIQTYVECFQFFIAPTDLRGNNANPQLAPHVIGNSWGCTSGEGCKVDSLESAVNAVVRAGIFMSVSAGNSGTSCSSVFEPPATYAASFSVGALGFKSNTIAGYSSRGPVTADGSNRLKPNIAAPGSSVRSSYPPSGYASLSGTSMASPHITGAIPIIWQAKPELLRDIEATVDLLQSSATPRPTTACSSPGNSPNNVYGYGELNVQAAVQKK